MFSQWFYNVKRMCERCCNRDPIKLLRGEMSYLKVSEWDKMAAILVRAKSKNSHGNEWQ